MFGWLASCMVIVFLMCKNINMHTYYTYSFTLILAVNLLKKRKEKKKRYLQLLMLIKKDIKNNSIIYKRKKYKISISFISYQFKYQYNDCNYQYKDCCQQ